MYFFECVMIWSVSDIGGLDLFVSFLCSCFLSCSFFFASSWPFIFYRCWLAPYPLYSALAFLSVCFRAPKTVCNQAFLLRATGREKKMRETDRQTDTTGSIVRCDCWRGTSLFDTQSKLVWWTRQTRGIRRTSKGQEVFFVCLFGCKIQIKHTQTMRLIVVMVFM